MPNKDFLEQFQQEPPKEFGQSLLASLRQLDAEEVKQSHLRPIEMPVPTAKSSLILLPRPRSRDRYLSWIASLSLFFFFASLLLFNLSEDESPNSTNSLSIASLTGLSQLAWSPDGRLLYLSDESYLYRLNMRLQVVDSWPLVLRGSVTTMQFAEEGRYLLLGDSSGDLSLWNTETMESVERLSVHDGALEVLAYLPDSRLILTSGVDSDLVSLSLRASQMIELSRLSLGDAPNAMRITGLSVAPNEQQLIATTSNAVSLIYEIRENGSLIASPAYALSSFPPSSQASYGLNGQFMTLVWWDTLRVVDSQTLAERYHYSLPEPLLWLSPLQSYGNRLLLSNTNGLLAIWDFERESYLEIYRGTTTHPLQAAFHPEGQVIAAITLANELRLWRIESLSDGSLSSSEVAVNRPSSNQAANENLPLALAPIGDENFGQLRELYHFGDGLLTETLWSPDGSLLMVSSSSSIRLYNENLRFLREWSLLGIDVTKSSFSPDGRYLFTGSRIGSIAVWDVLTGRNLTTLLVHDSALVFLAVLNGGSRILSRDESGEFALLDFNGNQLTVQTRSEQGALASYAIQDWQADAKGVRLLVVRQSSTNFSTSELVNLIELSLGASISAEETSTGLNGNLARFVSDERVLIYEQRENRIHLYGLEGMQWQDSIELPASIASLNYLAYDVAHEQLLLLDYDRSLSLFSLTLGLVRSVDNALTLLDRPADMLALHPSGNKAAVIISHNRIALWQFTESGNGLSIEEIANDMPVLGQINSFIMGSSNIAAASTAEGSVLLFDSITGNLLRRLNLETWGILNHDIRFSPDASLLAVLGQDSRGSNSILNIIDVEAAINGEADFHFGDSPHISETYMAGIAFTGRGDMVVTGGSSVRRWPMALEEPSGFWNVEELRGLTIFAHHPRLGELATIRPGNYLLLLDTVNMENRYLIRLYGRSMPANTFLEYSPDGLLIVMVGDGAAPQIFDSQSGDLLASLDGLNVTSFSDMLISPDSRFLYLATEQGILKLNLEEAIANPGNLSFSSLPIITTQLAISADSRRLLYLGRDGMVRVLGLPEN
jgi:WD40 repeat protein